VFATRGASRLKKRDPGLYTLPDDSNIITIVDGFSQMLQSMTEN